MDAVSDDTGPAWDDEDWPMGWGAARLGIP
jgi:hypothetical protein